MMSCCVAVSCLMQTSGSPSADHEIAGQVLQVDLDNAKAYIRQAKARHMLIQNELAWEDIQSAQDKAPGDSSLAPEAAALQRTIKQAKDDSIQALQEVVPFQQGPGNYRSWSR